MIADSIAAARSTSFASGHWARVAALALVIVALGLPVNQPSAYAALLIAAVLIFSGSLTSRGRNWLAALTAVAIAALVAPLLSPAPIAEGENVFLPGSPGNVLEKGLPADVHQFMQAEFDAQYPLSQRCKPASGACWVNNGFPDRLYAFSADGVFGKALYSRSETAIDFSDVVWLRLGFINDLRYNWYTDAPDVHRGDRDRRFWMGLRRWHVAMPFFVMYQFPAVYFGARLCWRGDVLWPGDGDRYAPVRHATTDCRELRSDDIGRKIFGVAIKPDSLAMTLHAPAAAQARFIASGAVRLLAAIVVLVLLWQGRLRDAAPAAALIGLSLIVIAIIDAGFIGGWRPMDGGDDGLFYTGVGRTILQHLINGDIVDALQGGENVYYYGGPGLRYFRALEMIVFGDTNFGYLSLVLLMPLIVLGLLRRFLSREFAWRAALVFTAVPIGGIFGTSFFNYAEWAARGFADPAAHVMLLWGIWVIIGPPEGARRGDVAAGGALLLALGVFIKPIVVPIAGITLAGAGLAALAQQQWPRVAGLCIGFLPVLVMPLHNWYFGHVFVLLSSNTQVPETYVMPPSAYVSALGELLRLDFGGAYLHHATAQVAGWLSEPSESVASIPFNLAAVVIVLCVTIRGRDFDPWLRLIGAAVLAEYAVDMIYTATPRYFFPMWLLSALIVAVFIERRVPAWMQKHGWQRAKRTLERSIGYRTAEAS
jgi:hypothetical protein